jgi:hypothetical protein
LKCLLIELDLSPIRVIIYLNGWITLVILATQVAETRRISVPSQLGQMVGNTTSLKYLTSKFCWRGLK